MTAIPFGLPPTGIVPTSRPDVASIRETVPSPEFATQIEPNPTQRRGVVRRPSSPPPSPFWTGSINQTWSLPTSETQTPPSPLAIPFSRNFWIGKSL